ncbi:SpvB/TcaC N-terminal domain-containing protein [Tessaracoccus sp. G1721]
MPMPRRALAVMSIFALIVTSVGVVPATSVESGGSGDDGIAASQLATDTLSPQQPISPQAFGEDDKTGLAQPDPTEGLSLIEAPIANNTGSMDLSYPIDIPPGHGITPELSLSYTSGGGNGWLGLGWDLGVGEVVVDTSFGAPHFDQAKESESYLLDGDLLTPNANGSAWENRVDGSRADYARQVETDFDEIIRHREGSGWPANYFWEVRSQDGKVRWYGGKPDSGGPAVATPASFDEASVVRNEAGHIVEWKLSAQRDVGVNLIRYEYQKVVYQFDGSAWIVNQGCTPSASLCGQHTFLRQILYTDATASVTDFNGAPYRVEFIRESQMPAPGAVRRDPVIDAGLGYVDVLVDRLARVEVRHGLAPASGAVRTYTDIAARYTFGYAEGRFGKSLLRTITQGVDDPHVHEIDWYDDLTGSGSSIDGLTAQSSQDTKSDVRDRTFLDETADVSALGGGESNGGSGNIYIGFNAAVPLKTGSFGAGIELSGADSSSLVEWIDLNGDNLPDKVFQADDGGIKFRLNTSGPGGPKTWDASDAVNLPSLSKDSNFGFQVSFEAYPLVAIGVGTGLAFSWSRAYFADVNADGLVDFVNNGTVLFNRLVGGIPTFQGDSEGTPVPLGSSALPSTSSQELDDLVEKMEKQSPPVDTVRRFVAPYTGSVLITAPVALRAGAGSTDGVRVAIQHDGDELVNATLPVGSSAPALTAPIPRSVTAGDRLYFRVGSIDDGVGDIVDWEPVVEYVSPTWPEFDANGQSQHRFEAAEDFTLAGRPGDFVALPLAGTVNIDAAVETLRTLSDDIRVVAVRRSPDGTLTRTVLGTVPFDATPGPRQFSGQVAVQFHPSPDDADVKLADQVSVFAEADSQVDLSALAWGATLTFDDGSPATDEAGDPVELRDANGDLIFEHRVRPHVEIYPYADSDSGVSPAALQSGESTYRFSLTTAAERPDGVTSVDAVVTVKSADALLAKQTVSVAWASNGDATSADFELDLPSSVGSGDEWLEIMFRDPQFTRSGLSLTEFVKVVTNAGVETTTDVPDAVLRWSGQQGIFPLPYRGWAVAGYTSSDDLGATRMEESAFEIQTGGSTPQNPQRSDISLDTETAEPSYAFVPAVPETGPGRWEGPRGESLWAEATGAQTSRLAVDTLRFDTQTAAGPGRQAPTRLGISGPGLNLSFGIAILGASASLSPSWGITDFEDLNGDGYPDVVSAGSVSYTDQLGDYLGSRGVNRTSVTNQDLTISVNGGLSSGMVDIVPNAKGGTNAVGGNSANKGQGASDSGPNYSLGISGSGGYSWSSPNASGNDTTGDSDYSSQISTLRSDFGAAEGAEIQRALADINGDGLPDSVYTTAGGVYAFYNLGYGFTARAVKLGSGGFESKESATAGAGLGFSLPYGEFGGGVNFMWNWDWSTYAWRDLNGDGILDRLRKDGSSSIKVAFGTGSGLLSEVTYGEFPTVEGSQHIAFDRGSGIGGGVSATAYIGPLCLVACYLVIGGGGGYNNAVSSTNVSVEDVDGDGYADVLQSMNDNDLKVQLNQHRRTNLIQGVTNPLGGSFSVDYRRMGNTTEHPDSVMVMSRVDIKDGRSTSQEIDGASTTGHYASSFTYEGLAYDRAHRASLGFATVTSVELDTTDGDAALRTTVQEYENENVFVSGLLREVTMLEGGGATAENIRGSFVEWGARVVRGPAGTIDVDSRGPATFLGLGADLGDLHSVASRGWSIAPAPLASDEYWYDGDPRTFERRTERTFDGRGNVLTERDLGAPDDDFDDLTTEITYTDCGSAGQSGLPCRPKTTPAQPYWSAGTCSTGVHLPVGISVTGVDAEGDSVLLRERLAPKGMCDNAAPLEIEELVSPGVYATTTMVFNQFGDYGLVMAPEDAQGNRYTVRYTYDADRHTDIAEVSEFDVPAANAAAVLSGGPNASNSTPGVSSSATFDPLSGNVASRTDANGAVREFSYDELGRIVTASAVKPPSVPGPAPLLVTYEYHATADDYAYAVARHVDELDGNPTPAATDAAGLDATATIDTIVFVDGMGRVRQTKRDARILTGSAPVAGRQVSDTVEFDPLARPVVTYGPTADPGPAAAFSAAASGGARTVVTWTSYDLLEQVVEPGNRVSTYEYPWEKFEGAGPLLAWTVVTDPQGRVTWLGQDVRDVVRAHIDQAAPRLDQTAPEDLATAYRVNSLGELLAVVDSAGNESTYAYDLAGRMTSATTPDGGSVESTFDLAGHRRVMTTPAMLDAGEQTSYRYLLNRLVAVDHPGSVDDVEYVYGLDNADGRFAAGRVSYQTDRTRLVTNSYDAAGNLAVQTATMKRQNWAPDLSAAELVDFTYTTKWRYDALGRVETVEYPDAKTLRYVPDGTSVDQLADPADLAGLLTPEDATGEVVTYGYDSGGLLRALTGVEIGLTSSFEAITPDAEGNPRSIQVPRRTTHAYTYLADRAYDPWLYPVRDELGNGAVTATSFDPETRWLTTRDTTSPAGALQRLSYTYDEVGRPVTYLNDLPRANRAINGGRAEQKHVHDGFGRVVGSEGTFDIKAGEQRRYSYGVEFPGETPWSIIAKKQADALFPTKGKSKPVENTTYSFTRDIGTQNGPLHVAKDEVTTADGKKRVYDSSYTANGEVSSVLRSGGAKPSTTNVWDRSYSWTLAGLMTSAERGAELKTYAYDDTGVLRIKDGSLLTRDGDVVEQHGGGPETLFLNPWVTVRSQKIYKHVTDGTDTLVTKMDAGSSEETTQMFVHRDVVGSTNMVSDVQGRGFQRHEYFPSGEMWIVDNKETIRTPFQYGDGYYEDTLDMILFGPRWYDSQRELFLAPDPILVDVPRALIDQPALGGAYTYAGASPLTNVDPSGQAFFSAHQRVGVKAKASAAFDARFQQLQADGKQAEAQAMLDKHQKQEAGQLRSETLLEANALITIDPGEGTVSVGLPYGPRKEWKTSDASDQAGGDAATGDDATNGQGAPDLANPASDQGSTTPSVSTSDSSDSDDDQAAVSRTATLDADSDAAASRSDE